MYTAILLNLYIFFKAGKTVQNPEHSLPEKLKWLFYGPSRQVLEYSSYMIDGVVFNTTKRDEARVVQNSGVSIHASIMQVASAKDKNPVVGDMVFYGKIDAIWELDYTTFRHVVLKCTWADNKNGVRIDDTGFILVNFSKIGYKSDSFILGNQAKPVFYIKDPEDEDWSVVLVSPNKRYTEGTKRDDLGDVSIQLQSFSKGLPQVDTNNSSDENEPPCVRDDFEGTWVNNTII